MRVFIKYIYICILLFCLCRHLSAQGNVQIDSLKKILLSSKPDSIKANSLIKLSAIFRAKGDLDTANCYALKSLKISKRINYKNGEAKALYYIGIVAYIRGNYVNSIDTMTKATKIFKDAGNKEDYSSVLTVIGGVKNAMGDLSGALECHLQSVKIKESIGDSANLASAYNNIGNVYLSTEEYNRALSYFNRALTLNLKYKNFDRVPNNYYSIANTLSEMRCDSLALINLNLAIHLSDSTQQLDALPYVYGLIASINFANDDLNGAVEYFQKSIAISEKLDDKRMIAAHCQRIGVVYQALGNIKKAESYILKALMIAEEINYLESIIECHLALSNLYENNGDYRKALANYKEYKILKDSLINEEKGKEMIRKEMNYEFDKKQTLNKIEQDKKDTVARERAKKQKIIIYSISFGLLLVIVILIVIFRSYKQKQIANNIITQQKEEVENQKNIIEEKHKEITDSINYAERIQRSFLATTELLSNNFNLYFVFFQPKDIVSGDFYWASKLRNGNFALVTADSTGHGVPGAIMSILNISSLEKAVEQGLSEPSEILNKTRRTIIDRLKNDGSIEGGKDGMDASLICFDFTNYKFSYSAANNPIWVIRENNLIELTPDKMPVGKHDKDFISFTQHEFKLKKDDVIYTFTDGLPDQFGGPNGKKFMYKQFKELLLANNRMPFIEQKERLKKAINDWKGCSEQIDDITVLGIKI